MRIEYAEFLNTKPWDYFCTLTTRYKLSKEGARRAMEKFIANLKRHGQLWVFWSCEKGAEGHHLHALVRINQGHEPVQKAQNLISKAWNSSTGKGTSHAEILLYDPDKGANYYVTKYIHHANADYGFEFAD